MLMKHRDDRQSISFIHEIERIGKSVKQSAAYTFFNDWKHQWVVGDSLKGSSNLAQKSNT